MTEEEQLEKRLELEEENKKIARAISGMTPPGTTFNLITATVGEQTQAAYISNTQRESAIEMMKEMLHRWNVNQ